MAACLEPNNLLIVTDYMPRGSLSSILHSPETLSFARKMSFGRDIASGLSWLHGQVLFSSLVVLFGFQIFLFSNLSLFKSFCFQETPDCASRSEAGELSRLAELDRRAR
jgi:serine/threonine protein kinase